MKKLILVHLIILVAAISFMPNMAFAQERLCEDKGFGNFIPCGSTDCPCRFEHLIILINRGLDFLTNTIAVPLAIITFMYAGFLLMTTAVADNKSKAKGMMRKVVIGFAILLAANLIVKTVLTVLLDKSILDIIDL